MGPLIQLAPRTFREDYFAVIDNLSKMVSLVNCAKIVGDYYISESNGRTGIMGRQPNPWELVPIRAVVEGR